MIIFMLENKVIDINSISNKNKFSIFHDIKKI